jgi:hypothetical protein
MIRDVSRIAAAVAVAAVPVALFGGAAQAGGPKNQDGPDGKPGTAIAICRGTPPQDDDVLRCTASGGAPGAGGQAVDY